MSYSAVSQKKYNDKNFTFITLKLHNERDQDILELIEALTSEGLSRQAAIKQLILKK